MYIRVYNRLNVKFTNIDGREVVFKYSKTGDGLLITDYPDKGTYNYFPGEGPWPVSVAILAVESLKGGKHYKWDMEPYDKLMEAKKRTDSSFGKLFEDLTNKNGGDKYNAIDDFNSSYWR
jgi:hypothetical protein